MDMSEACRQAVLAIEARERAEKQLILKRKDLAMAEQVFREAEKAMNQAWEKLQQTLDKEKS